MISASSSAASSYGICTVPTSIIKNQKDIQNLGDCNVLIDDIVININITKGNSFIQDNIPELYLDTVTLLNGSLVIKDVFNLD